MNKQVESTINNHALYAAGGGLIPIPIIDFMAVSGIQIDMLQELCVIYEVDFYKSQVKSFISALAGTTLASLGSSFIKAIPGLGSVLGGVSMSVLSGATTYAIGHVFATHFENGGTMEDLDIEEFKNFYNQKLEEGKKIVRDLKQRDEAKKKTEKSSNPRQEKLQEKLEEVKRLLESGIITKAEYDKMRQQLFDEYLG